MLSLAALPVQTITATAPGVPADAAGDAAATGGFASLLASLTPPVDAAEGAAPAQAALTTAAEGPAAPPATPGNILPLLAAPAAGPTTDLVADHAEPAGKAHALGQEVSAAVAELRIGHQPGAVAAMVASLKAARAAAPDQPADPADDQAEPAPTTAEATALPLAIIAPLALPAPAETAQSEPVAPAAAEARPAPQALPGLIAAQLQGLPLRREAAQGERTTQAPAEPAAPEPARIIPLAALDPAAARAARVTFEDTARPATAAGAVHLRAALASATESATLPTDSALPLADPLGQTMPAADPVVATTAATPVEGAHDFAALVDRLIAARDAARPEAVSVAIQHAEFGAVSLHFSQDEAGLSVSMASADPGFARAVQAAIPAPGAAPESTGTGAQGEPQQQQAFARNDGAGAQQQRGQAQEQPARAGRAATNQPQASRSDDEAPARRAGRFA
jgi:hypothetical protein